MPERARMSDLQRSDRELYSNGGITVTFGA